MIFQLIVHDVQTRKEISHSLKTNLYPCEDLHTLVWCIFSTTKTSNFGLQMELEIKVWTHPQTNAKIFVSRLDHANGLDNYDCFNKFNLFKYNRHCCRFGARLTVPECGLIIVKRVWCRMPLFVWCDGDGGASVLNGDFKISWHLRRLSKLRKEQQQLNQHNVACVPLSNYIFISCTCLESSRHSSVYIITKTSYRSLSALKLDSQVHWKVINQSEQLSTSTGVKSFFADL